MNFIQKRNGQTVPFEQDKITQAVKKAMLASEMDANRAETEAKKISDEVCAAIEKMPSDGIVTVEDVQDEAEKALIRNNFAAVAKAYILYRKKHQMIREASTGLNRQLEEIFGSSALASDLKRDNANIDGNSAMGTMLQVGAAASKSFYANNYLTEKEKAAHQSGDIHIHDFDFYALTETCCQIDFKSLAARGFSTGHGFIRPPQSIASYAALACIAIQSNQNDQHGGQSIPNFDYAMADGVRKSFRKTMLRRVAEAIEENTIWGDETVDWEALTEEEREETAKRKALEIFEKFDSKGKPFDISDASSKKSQHELGCLLAMCCRPLIFDKEMEAQYTGIAEFICTHALRDVKRETHQAMESLIHNLNSMHSRAGAQVPFSSLNYGTDTSEEGRLVMHELLKATDEGLGDGETPIFPIQIFKVKDGVNYNPGDPNYDLFKLAMKVSAKRLFPNFTFIDAPFNLQYYKPGHPETEVATMGCRTRVMGNVYDPTREISYGRGNLSFTSINLPRLAILANGNEKKFYASLSETMELVAQQLLHRLEIQSNRRVYNYPFLMGQGVWLDSEKLGPNDKVGEVLKHGSLSIGFIGLAETLTALYGHHHGESEEMQKKGLEIIGFMRDFCDRKAELMKLNFTLLATPAEGLSGYFVRKDKKLFGSIPGVTDREYYTNSFHIPVWFPISAYEKIQKEAPYHALCNAGHISYVELDGDTANNIEAFEAIVRCMHDAGIGYGSINHPVDRDPVCGYVGVIGDVCPRCGRREGEALTEEQLAELRNKYPQAPIFSGKI